MDGIYISKFFSILKFMKKYALNQGCPTGGPREVVGEKLFQKNFFQNFFISSFYEVLMKKYDFRKKIFHKIFDTESSIIHLLFILGELKKSLIVCKTNKIKINLILIFTQL